MKGKFALWSWILPLLGLFLYPGTYIIMLIINSERYGYRGNIFTDLIAPFTIFLMLMATLLGLIFGIVALKKVSKNPELKGKASAIVGIIFSVIVLLYGCISLAL